MSWLSGWLHELILVVLMAAFVEMLLPSKSMERYARLVLSLLVLLTMLSPIVSMLKGTPARSLVWPWSSRSGAAGCSLVQETARTRWRRFWRTGGCWQRGA